VVQRVPPPLYGGLWRTPKSFKHFECAQSHKWE